MFLTSFTISSSPRHVRATSEGQTPCIRSLHLLVTPACDKQQVIAELGLHWVTDLANSSCFEDDLVELGHHLTWAEGAKATALLSRWASAVLLCKLFKFSLDVVGCVKFCFEDLDFRL